MLTLDLRALERAADAVKATRDQLPFAISLALNNAAAATETRLARETWGTHTANRNKGFFKAAMAIDMATKGRLSVALYDSKGRAKIALHAHGGTAVVKGRFAIPTSAGSQDLVRRRLVEARRHRPEAEGGQGRPDLPRLGQGRAPQADPALQAHARRPHQSRRAARARLRPLLPRGDAARVPPGRAPRDADPALTVTAAASGAAR